MGKNKVLFPLGSVVRLNNSSSEYNILIINRVVLGKWRGEEGYFEYAGCLHKTGAIESEFFYFNTENISKVLFLGYSDDLEENEFQIRYQAFLDKAPLKKLKLED